jgi:DNA-binding NarL/FixJ family response regulator
LARRLQAERPGLKVLFMSGYSAEWAGREAELQPTEKFLPKPCPPDQLLQAVRACLDG